HDRLFAQLRRQRGRERGLAGAGRAGDTEQRARAARCELTRAHDRVCDREPHRRHDRDASRLMCASHETWLVTHMSTLPVIDDPTRDYGDKIVAVEPGGVEFIPLDERHGSPLQMLWTWTSPN